MRDGPRGFGQDFSCPGLLRCRLAPCLVFAYGALTLCGAAFQRLPLTFSGRFVDGPTTPRDASPRPRFGLGRFRSPLLTPSLVCFLFLRVLRCFSSPGSPPARPGGGIAPAGLPHSEIRASTGICPYARLIAACHVLRRLREPRHPSCALLSFPLTFAELLQGLSLVNCSFVAVLSLAVFEFFARFRFQHVNVLLFAPQGAG